MKIRKFGKYETSLLIGLAALLTCIFVARIVAQDGETRLKAWQDHIQLLENSPFRGMRWQPLGPSLQGARIEALAVSSPGSSTIYAGPGAGNIWKSVNNGMTWEPIFEHESAFAIGDIAVAPSNPDILWVGTGEVQPRHSGPAYAGTGVFKSTDAGKTWKNMGLADTFHIGKVVIHPKNPDIVYVAAMGHFRSLNKERGVFRTTNGGRTWEKVLYISEKTGVIDLVMDPSDPRTLFASAWQMPNGTESGIYRTTDGGSNWKQLGGGLPEGTLGRSGLDIAPTNSRVIYAFIDNWAIWKPESAASNQQRKIVGGEVYRSADRGENWQKVNTEDIYEVFGIYGWKFCDVRVSPDNENEIYILGNRAFRSTDSGKTYQRIGETIRRVNNTEGTAMHLDHHELWIDPANPNRLLLGNDGGVFMSYDRGRTWLHLNNLPIGQFYFVSVDMQEPYTIFGGTQDNGGLYTPSDARPADEPAANDEWRHVWLDQWTGGDAFVLLRDPTDSRFVYYEHQNGAMMRMNLADQNPYSGGPATENIRPRPPVGEAPWRFGWFTPFFVSQHEPRTLYAGGNVVLKSTNRGSQWRAISPDLSEPAADERAAVPTGTITTLAESRFAPGILYAGTEGGNLYLTKDDGRNWKKISEGLPKKWISRIVASDYEPATVYVSMTGYREDDFTSYLYRSTDFGASWKSIANNLPAESINVIREDPQNANLLYVGTDAGVYVSLDRGASWQSLCADLPTTPVHDLVIHPRESELIIATHGRSMFLMDVRPLQMLNSQNTAADLHVFDVRPVKLKWRVTREVEPFSPRGKARIHYWLKEAQTVTITISKSDGELIQTLQTTGLKGLNEIVWDIRTDKKRDAPPGVYQITVVAANRTVSTNVIVKPAI
ncbi:MAG: hypothetical protein K1X72_11955 [Pyrinomonadaceae bacterium]|nr:hypothetical protein [Pyrinomonadaceae bacterium]